MNRALVIAANKLRAAILPDNQQWKNRLEIKSETSTRLYVVAQRKSSGEWACSCPGWKAHRHCKHLIAMQPALLQIKTSEETKILPES